MADPLLDGEKKGGPTMVNGAVVEELLKMPDLNNLSDKAAADKFLESEEFYVERGLRVISETFENRLHNHIKVQRPVIEQMEVSQIFLNITNIYDFNRQLLAELRKLRLDGIQALLQGMGAVMKRFIPFFKLYTSYIKGHRKSIKFLEDLQKNQKRFRQFVELNQMCVGYSLYALLETPVSRLPQYLIYLGTIHQAMESSGSGSPELAGAINAIQEVTDNIAFSLRDEAARKLVVTVQDRIFGNSVDLVSPHRYVAKHGDLKVVNPKSIFSSRFSQYLFILFNDFILIGTRPGTLMSGKCKHVMRLEGLTLIDEPNADDYKNAFRIRGDDQNYLVCAPNPAAKEKWLEAIREQLTEVKKTLNTSTMSAKDFENLIKKATPKAENKVGGGVSGPTSTGGASSGVSGPMNVQRVGGQGPNLLTMNTRTVTPVTSTTSSNGTSSHGGNDSRGAPPPPPSQGNPNIKGDWEKILDDGSGDYYYENLKTGLTQWEEPAEWSAPPPPVKKEPPMPPMNRPTTLQPSQPTSQPSSQASRPLPSVPSQPVRPTVSPTANGNGPSPPSMPSRPMPQPPTPSSDSRGPPPPPPGDGPSSSSGGRGPPPPPPGEPSSNGGESSGPAPANSLQAQLAAAKLKKSSGPQQRKASAAVAPGGLNQALKQSLDRYRKFVQDDEEDIEQGKDDEGWAD